jgi:hypothetical protein
VQPRLGRGTRYVLFCADVSVANAISERRDLRCILAVRNSKFRVTRFPELREIGKRETLEARGHPYTLPST